MTMEQVQAPSRAIGTHGGPGLDADQRGTDMAIAVEKRDGRVVSFDPVKIVDAVTAAFREVRKGVDPRDEQTIQEVAGQASSEIRARYEGAVRIDEIQNVVEHALIDAHVYDVAQAYVTYRLHKDIARAKATDVNEAVRRLLSRDASLVRENANKDSNVYATCSRGPSARRQPCRCFPRTSPTRTPRATSTSTTPTTRRSRR